jgi:hypothetical protein
METFCRLDELLTGMETFCDGGRLDEVALTQRTGDVGIDCLQFHFLFHHIYTNLKYSTFQIHRQFTTTGNLDYIFYIYLYIYTLPCALSTYYMYIQFEQVK